MHTIATPSTEPIRRTDEPRSGAGATIRRLGSPGPAWLVVALPSTALAVAQVATGVAPWWMLLVFAVLPDLSFLAAIGTPDIGEELPRRAVPVYNTLHRLVVPVGLTAAASVELVPRSWTVAGLAWMAHIAFDRAVGYGLRDRDGRQRG